MSVAEFNMVESFQTGIRKSHFRENRVFLTLRKFFLTTSNCPKMQLEIVIYIYNKLALWKFSGNRLISTDVFPRFSGIYTRFSIGFAGFFTWLPNSDLGFEFLIKFANPKISAKTHIWGRHTKELTAIIKVSKQKIGTLVEITPSFVERKRWYYSNTLSPI